MPNTYKWYLKEPDELLFDYDVEAEAERTPSTMLFQTGALFPPQTEIPRLARYMRGGKLFKGKFMDIFYRANSLLKDTVHEDQLNTLYIACNIVDLLCTKPADLMYGEPPTYESGKPSDSREQQALNAIVEENDLNLLGQELVTGAAYRGDAFIKVRFGYREDFSELGYIPDGVKMEPIIEPLDPATVFPEMQKGSRKKFKAINIATIEWVDEGNAETPYLNVERHIPGQIQYYRFRLEPMGLEGYKTEKGVGIATYTIGERVPTGRPSDIVETGVPRILVSHFPYKATDDDWRGISLTEQIEGLISAISDRLTQIDYILWKHTDPNIYGVDLDGAEILKMGGKYIPVQAGEVPPTYMTWASDAQLNAAFQEISLLLSLVYQIAETPQWLFGTTAAGSESSGGHGTSHTDAGAIKARFMPILSKVKRIRTYVDRAIRDAIYNAMALENIGNEGVDGFESYEPVYPKIVWNDGVPRDEKEMAEVMSIRLGGKATIDVKSAIKRLDNLDDAQAEQIMNAIHEDNKAEGFVDANAFHSHAQLSFDNGGQGGAGNGGGN